MHACEGMMSRRMPVLSENYVFKSWSDSMDQIDHLVAVRHSKRATGTKVVLNVDD